MSDRNDVVTGTAGVLRENQRELTVSCDQTYFFHRIGLPPETFIAEETSFFGWNDSSAKLLAAHASLGLTDKRDECFNLRNSGQLGGNLLERIFGSELGLEDNAVGLTDGIDDASVEAAAFQAFEIKAVQFGAVTGGITVGRNIL